MSISVKNVTKRFGTFLALDDVSLDVPPGELLALLGPSGSGKTTLLRIISGLDKADRGTVLYQDEDVTDAAVRERNVGFVFQHYALFRHMTVFDNVAFGLRVRKRPKAEIRDRVRELLRLVQLEGLERSLPSQLSGGQRQRVALARALAAEPKVLLLDEQPHLSWRHVHGVAHLQAQIGIAIPRHVDVQHHPERLGIHAHLHDRARRVHVDDLGLQALPPVPLAQDLQLVRADEGGGGACLVVRVFRVGHLQAAQVRVPALHAAVEDVHVAEKIHHEGIRRVLEDLGG